jgi:ribonuclease Z
MGRRLLLIGLIAVVAGGALLTLLRGPLGLRIVRQMAERNLATDLAAELPDGLHVLLCGAGGPLPDPLRSGPCVAVVAGSTLLVVDAGSSAARNLMRMGLPPGRVETVLLTHFHSDHIDGLGELALLRWTGAAHATPLSVIGPPGVAQVVDGFNRAYRLDAGYRTAHHGEKVAPPGGAGMQARPFATPAPGVPEVVWERDGLRVIAFSVDHAPVRPAVGYRFDYAGRSALVSGDTRRSEELLRNAQGVDLLVHEALGAGLVAVVHDAAVAAGRDNLAKITADIPGYHTTPLEAAQIAEAAGAGHLLLYHVVPPMPLPGLESVFLDGVADVYSGPVTVGRDGTLVSLPRGSKAIEVSRR